MVRKEDESVANISLGGGYYSALNRAVVATVTAGITFAGVAGNGNTDTSTTFPASEASAITVGATEQTDARAYYSNYGSIVDVFAPGTGITSAWIGSTTASNTISGTSMAMPHVTGLAAYLIAKEELSGSKAVTARIKALARAGSLPIRARARLRR
ncbi:hypothetical protein RUND412_002439 [Rhizina undulata]